MTLKEMHKALDRANAALVDKLEKQPFTPLRLSLYDSGKWCCTGAYIDMEMNERIGGDFFDTPEEAFASVMEKIEKRPKAADAERAKWQRKLADVIDEGNTLSLPDDVMQPLRAGSQAMTKNLLTSDA